MSDEFSFYEDEIFRNLIKCDKLVELGKDFEKARKDGGGALSYQLESLVKTYNWDVDLCIAAEIINQKFDVNEQLGYEATSILQRVANRVPVEELTDIKKAERVASFVKKIGELGLDHSGYDADYIVYRIEKEFAINQP